jgi:hypothetical protein
MRTPRNLRLVPGAATTDVSLRFETVARLRFRVLARACFSTQEECADYLKTSVRSVQRWFRGAVRVPAWVLMALEQRSRECGVAVAEHRKAA